MSLIPLDGSYEQHMISSQAFGPLSTVTVLPRRPRRGGRKATALPKKESRRNIDPLLSDEARRRNAALARKLGACSRCEKQRIRCLIDPDDHLGPCLTCIRSQKLCPRFEAQQSSGTLVTQLMPHHYDVYRVLVEDRVKISLDVEDPIARLLVSNFGDMVGFFYQNPNAPFPNYEFSENQLVAAILLIYGSSNDLLWNTFRIAFKMAFNPIMAARAQVLRTTLYLWLSEVLFHSRIVSSNTTLETVQNAVQNCSSVQAAWDIAEAKDPKLRTRSLPNQLHVLESYSPHKFWEDPEFDQFLAHFPDLESAGFIYLQTRFQLGVWMTHEREQLATREDKLSRLLHFMSYFVYERTGSMKFYRDDDLGCPKEYIDLVFKEGVDEIEL